MIANVTPDIAEPMMTTATGIAQEAPSARALETRVAIRRLLCFFALLGVLAFAANAVIGYGLRHLRTTAYGAWNEAMAGKANADILISGSSRAAYHFDPRIIQAVTGETAFNLGRNGSQTDVQLIALRAYLEHNRKPRLIIHNLDAFSFVTTTEIYDPPLYVPYLNDPVLYEPLRAIDPDLVKSRYIPLYGYVVEDMNFSWVLGIRALLGIAPPQEYYQGFSPQNRSWTDDFEKFKESNPQGVSFPIQPRGVQAVEQLIQLCRDRGIQLILVYSPEYAQMQAMTKNRAQIFSEFRALAARYQVPLWDYSHWKYDGDRDYFYNSQHLNAIGAESFSKDLAQRLQTYLQQNPDLRGAPRATALSNSPVLPKQLPAAR